MDCHKLVDVPIYHPLRYHSKLIPGHDRPQQWQHVWVSKSFPSYDFLAEPLQRLSHSVSQHAQGYNSPLVAHVSNIQRTVVVAWAQNLDRDLPATMFTLPHVPKPTTVHWDTHWIPV